MVNSQTLCCHDMLDEGFFYVGNILKGTFIFGQTSQI